jgi:hypothetical protein
MRSQQVDDAQLPYGNYEHFQPSHAPKKPRRRKHRVPPPCSIWSFCAPPAELELEAPPDFYLANCRGVIRRIPRVTPTSDVNTTRTSR